MSVQYGRTIIQNKNKIHWLGSIAPSKERSVTTSLGCDNGTILYESGSLVIELLMKFRIFPWSYSRRGYGPATNGQMILPWHLPKTAEPKPGFTGNDNLARRWLCESMESKRLGN
ncbi:hypothetical protein LguiA_019335 [Lonicera macranthoides]